MAILPTRQNGGDTSSKSEPLVATLEAREGNKFAENGECIGTYNRRCIVFMPRDCEPSKTYRVELSPLVDRDGNERKDRGGNVMYRSRPAKPEYFERWRDNGDGTASRVTFSKNWKLEEDEEGVSETRPLAARDGEPRQSTTTEVVWGASLNDTVVRQSTTTTIPEIQEKILDGKLVERETGTRDGGTTAVDHLVASIAPDAYQSGWTKSWWNHRLVLQQDEEAGVHLTLAYGDASYRHSSMWEDLPAWVQAHLMAPYPVCSCSSHRVDTPAGKSVCAQCTKEHGQLELIEQHLPPERRQEIARVAALCWQASESGQVFEGTSGWDLLQALMSEDPRANSDWQGYPWYYMTTEGFYASRFPPVAMMILSSFGSAQGQGLVRLAAWLPWEPSLHRCEAIQGSTSDFYERTQVRGQSEEPTLDYRRLTGACAAVRLCGTIAQRQAAVESVRAYKAAGGESWELDSLLSNHDYAGAVTKATELEVGLADRRRLQELLGAEYATCPACKREWQESRKRGKHCECLRHLRTQDVDFPVKHTLAPDGDTVVQVLFDSSGYLRLQVRVDKIPEGSQTRVVWAPTRSELTAWDRLAQAQSAAAAARAERDRADGGENATRVRLTWDRQLSQGKLFAIVRMSSFPVQWHDGTTDTVDGEVRFVCDPNRCKWLDEQGISRPRPGETWFCSWRRASYGADTIGRDRQGRPIVIANPQVPDDPNREARLEREAQEAEAEVVQVKVEADKARATGELDLSRLLAKLGQA